MKISRDEVQLDPKLQPREGVDQTTVGVYASPYDLKPDTNL